MGNLAIDGLVSGLDTTTLIKQLMQVEAMPQALLAQKKNSAQNLSTALQALNTKIASLADAAKTAASAKSWQTQAASSSAESVTATTSEKAQTANFSFTVDQVASSQVSLIDIPSTFETDPPTFTVIRGGEEFTVTAASSNPADIVSAFNKSDSGVRAAAIRVTGGDNPTYRIQFTGAESGTDNAFDIVQGEGAGGTSLVSRADATRAAKDAQITLFPGTDNAVQLASSTNTFEDITPGVNVTVSKVEEDPVVIDITPDTKAMTKLASNLVSQLSQVFSEIASRSATTTTKDDDGRTVITGGLFSGDSAVRGINQQLLTVASAPIDGKSPSVAGIEITKDGSFTFDEEKFTALLASDPELAQRMISGIAANVEAAATAVSDKYEGTLTLKIQNQETAIRDMGEQISAWDRRLDIRRSSLERTYAALEVTLSQLQSQSSWLAGQLGSLSQTN